MFLGNARAVVANQDVYVVVMFLESDSYHSMFTACLYGIPYYIEKCLLEFVRLAENGRDRLPRPDDIHSVAAFCPVDRSDRRFHDVVQVDRLHVMRAAGTRIL